MHVYAFLTFELFSVCTFD